MLNDNQNIGLGVNEEFQNNRNVFITENLTLSDKQIGTQEAYNFTINPHLDKIKLYKEHLKSKLALENSVIESQKHQYDEKQYLANFASGAVEYGLPCEVIYNRSLEVKIICDLFNLILF